MAQGIHGTASFSNDFLIFYFYLCLSCPSVCLNVEEMPSIRSFDGHVSLCKYQVWEWVIHRYNVVIQYSEMDSVHMKLII